MKLNLGSGNIKKEGFVNIDIYPFENVNIVHDIEKSLPFENDTFDEIYSNHVLEHCSTDSILSILKECYRIIKQNGEINIEVPCLECVIKKFLEFPEEKRWSYPIEYIYGNQGRSQTGQQYHHTGFTPARLEFLVRQAGFEIIYNYEYINNLDMTCIKLRAIKK